jgi:signal transduction histidine kinase
MLENLSYGLSGAMKRLVHALLRLSTLRVAVLLLIVAIIVWVMIVLTIDFLWDGRFNAELEFAGVITPALDGLLIVGMLTALLGELRKEVVLRKVAENAIRKLNEELDAKIQERTLQLLDAQEELVRKEKLAVLGLVTGSVGHELRNPLGVMSNAVYFLQTVLADADDTTKEYLNIIKSEIAGSERIVSDLLDSVRTKPPQIQTVGIAELIGQTLRKCRVPATVTVKLDIPATLLPLRVDAMQIQQVFRNLISNGVEAMPEGGTLEIHAVENKQDGTVTVSVRESGIGLGLMVVKNLTQVNGGRAEVQSEVDKGSVFSVTLPGDNSAVATAERVCP